MTKLISLGIFVSLLACGGEATPVGEETSSTTGSHGSTSGTISGGTTGTTGTSGVGDAGCPTLFCTGIAPDQTCVCVDAGSSNTNSSSGTSGTPSTTSSSSSGASSGASTTSSTTGTPATTSGSSGTTSGGTTGGSCNTQNACTIQHAACGQVYDDCGNPVECPDTCNGQQSCVGTQCQTTCNPITQATCTTCGIVSDGCGGMVNCGGYQGDPNDYSCTTDADCCTFAGLACIPLVNDPQNRSVCATPYGQTENQTFGSCVGTPIGNPQTGVNICYVGLEQPCSAPGSVCIPGQQCLLQSAGQLCCVGGSSTGQTCSQNTDCCSNNCTSSGVCG